MKLPKTVVQDLDLAKAEIVAVGCYLASRHYHAALAGNISARVARDFLLCTCHGADKGSLTFDDLVLCELKGKKLDGRGDPTSELIMHRTAYQVRPELQAVVHAHPPMATAFAATSTPLDQLMLPEMVDWLTLNDAYAVQRAVAKLRMARGERCLGYKVGCVSPAIQNQFGLHQPVRGYVWESEAHISGCRLSPSRFANLAIEGEIVLRLSRDITSENVNDADLWDCVECWYPVIELHNYVFRGTKPTSQELVAANALHAGLVAARFAESSVAGGAWPRGAAAVALAEIRMEIDDQLVEAARPADLPGGPLGSMRWLVSSLAQTAERLTAGQIVLTGCPGRLIPITETCVVRVACAGRPVELFVERSSRNH